MKRIVQIVRTDAESRNVTMVWLTTGQIIESSINSVTESLTKLGLQPKRLEGLLVTWDTAKEEVVRYIADTRQDILVDKHQPKAHIQKLRGVSASLVSGDYAWTTVHGYTVGIEAKLTASDIYASLWAKEGEERSRLAGQIPRLVETYDIPILLLNAAEMDCTPDGLFRIPALAHRGEDVTTRSWSAVQNTLLGYQLRYPKLNIWASRKTWRVVDDIVAIKRYLNKTNFKSQATSPSAITKFCEKDMPPDVAWLAARVGPTAARQALLCFRDLFAIINATEKELRRIPGWGPKTIYKLQSVLRRPVLEEREHDN